MKQIVPPTAGLAVSLVLILGLGTGFAHPFAPLPVPDENVEGTWLGTLQAGGVALRIVFHISRDSVGVLTATIDSPDQGAIGIQVGAVTVTGDTLVVDGGALEITEGSAVFGNLEAINTTTVTVTDSVINGNVLTQNNESVRIEGNTILGNLESTDDGTVTITGNMVSNNLQIINPTICTDMPMNTVGGTNSGCPVIAP